MLYKYSTANTITSMSQIPAQFFSGYFLGSVSRQSPFFLTTLSSKPAFHLRPADSPGLHRSRDWQLSQHGSPVVYLETGWWVGG